MTGDDEPAGRRAAERAAATATDRAATAAGERAATAANRGGKGGLEPRGLASATMAAGRSQPALIPCENEKRSRISIRAKVQSIYKRYGPHRPHDHMGQKYSYLYYCIHIYLTPPLKLKVDEKRSYLTH